MPNPLINIGAAINDGTGELGPRGWLQKINRLPIADSTINAGSGDYTGTTEQKITAAIAAAVAAGAKYVWIPQSMLPYNASLVTFNNAIRMTREGGDPNTYDVLAYGARGDGVTSDTYAFASAIRGAAGVAGVVGQGGRVAIPQTVANTFIMGSAGAMNASAILQLYGGLKFEATGGGDSSPTLQLAAGANGFSLIQIPINVQGIVIRDIKLDGNKANVTGTSYGLWIQGNGTYLDNRNVFQNIFISNFATSGVFTEFNASEMEFDFVIVRSCGGDGWVIQGSDTHCTKCDSGFNGGRGVFVTTGFLIWNGGGSFFNTSHGILVAPSAISTKFDGVDVQANQKHGVYIQGSHTTVTRCILRDNGQELTNTYNHVNIDPSLTNIAVFGNNFRAKSLTNQALANVSVSGTITRSALGPNTYEALSASNELVATAAPGVEVFWGRPAKFISVTYSASMTLDLALLVPGDCYFINATNGTAFSVAFSNIPADNHVFTIFLENTSGGALGAITWPGTFKQAGIVSPATGFSRLLQAQILGTGTLRLLSQSPADIPN